MFYEVLIYNIIVDISTLFGFIITVLFIKQIDIKTYALFSFSYITICFAILIMNIGSK